MAAAASLSYNNINRFLENTLLNDLYIQAVIRGSFLQQAGKDYIRLTIK